MWAQLIAVLCFLASIRDEAAASGPELDLDAGHPTALYRRAKAWSDYAEPVAVLELGAAATVLHFVPGDREAATPRFLAVGDAAGGLLLLTAVSARTVAHASTGTTSPVTALGSYRLAANATVLLTGHASGELRLMLLEEPRQGSHSQEAADDWDAANGRQPASLNLLQALPAAGALCSLLRVGGPQQCGEQQGPGACSAAATPEPCAAIAAVHGAGRGGRAASTALILDTAGGLAVLKHGGLKVEGAHLVRQLLLEQPPLATRLAGHAATLLGSGGSASQRLGAPPPDAADAGATPPPPFRPCSGLNGSAIAAAAFDPLHPSRAYATTGDGRVLSLAVGGERGGAPGCRVRAAAPLPADLAAVLSAVTAGQAQGQRQQQQVALAVVPGYLLMAAGGGADALALFNVTAAPRAAPRLLLRQPLAALRRQFGLAEAASAGVGAAAAPPLLAASRQGHVALTLAPSVLALYETALPFRPPQAPSAAMSWLQLFQPAAMVLVAGMVIYRGKKRRGGGGGGGPAADPRLREFERLLRDPMAGVGRRARPQPSLGGNHPGLGPDDSGSASASASDGEDAGPLGALLRSRAAAAGASPPRRRPGGLFGRSSTPSAGGGGAKERAAARSRAFARAAADDRETAAAGVPHECTAECTAEAEAVVGEEGEGLACEFAGGYGGGGQQGRLAGLAGAFGSDIDMRSSMDVRSSVDAERELSQLRHRLGLARIS